jgi:hypothetical protein
MSVPSLEADLRASREAAGVSIEQIQQETRIPADVIQRFEAGRLLTDSAFNVVYLKAFLRAYAGAVGVTPNRVLAAYEAVQAGTYRGELNPAGPAVAAEVAEAAAPGPSAPEPVPAGPEPEEGATAAPERGMAAAPSLAEKAPAVAALSRAPEPPARPRPVEAPNEHFPKRRVAPAATLAAPRAFDRAWGTIIVATLGFVAVVAVVLWLLFRDATPEPETEVVAADTTGAADTAAVGADTAAVAPPATSGPPLALPISVTVLAGGDGLQNFRVTELPNARLGHWVEPGTERSFQSSEGVILWGEGAEGLDPAEVTLRWQGFRWSPPEGQVLHITAQNGQRLLDSLQAAGIARAGAAPAPPR